MKLRSRSLSTELSSRASAIGIGKNRISCTKLRESVFFSDPQNSGSAKIRLNWSKPTHSLCRIPTSGSYSWKAVTRPNNGT